MEGSFLSIGLSLMKIAILVLRHVPNVHGLLMSQVVVSPIKLISSAKNSRGGDEWMVLDANSSHIVLNQSKSVLVIIVITP
jgi:hypothetical protein